MQFAPTRVQAVRLRAARSPRPLQQRGATPLAHLITYRILEEFLRLTSKRRGCNALDALRLARVRQDDRSQAAQPTRR